MSSESDISKYAELLVDVNQLNFPENSKTYQFDINDLQDEGTIFENDNAVIEHYVFRPLKFSLVAKILPIPIYRKKINKERLKVLLKEVKILRESSQCINVVDFYGYALYGKKVWIFMEPMKASLEDLYKYFHKKLYPESQFSSEVVIPEGVIGYISYSMLSALAFCAKQRVMHLDVKPRNVLVNQKGEVKICDFGASEILESESKTITFAGTLPYIPPERFNTDQKPYDDRNDIWSLGITLVEIAYGDIPYDIKEFTECYFDQIMNIIKNVDAEKIMRQCFSENYSIVLRSFIRDCLEEFSSRPRYSELMERMLYKSFEFKNGKEYIMKLFIDVYLKSLNIEKNPLDPKANFDRGDAQYALGNYNEVITDYTKTIEVKPIDADVYYYRERIQEKLYNKAIADYTKVIELNPTSASAYCNRGNVQNELRKHKEAIADYTKAIELDPTDAIDYNNRGSAQGQLGQYNEAIADCTKAIELNPTYAKAYCTRGNVQGQLGQYNEAIADCTKAIELNPTYAKAYCTRGNVQGQLGKHNEAMADYTKAIELDPTYAIAYCKRGILQYELRKYNEAIADCTKAIELNPTYANAYCNRGRAQRQLGQYNEAIADYTKFIKLNPTHAIAYCKRGILQYELRKYNEAIADYTKAIELNTTDANFYCNRGIAQCGLGKYNEAIADYTKAIELKPSFEFAINNRKMLMRIINLPNNLLEILRSFS